MSDNLDDLANKLDTLSNKSKALAGNSKIPANELFDKSFLTQHTNNRFSNFDEFMSAGNFSATSFDDIPQNDLDSWVAQVTDFQSWQDMLSVAGKKYIARKLGF